MATHTTAHAMTAAIALNEAGLIARNDQVMKVAELLDEALGLQDMLDRLPPSLSDDEARVAAMQDQVWLSLESSLDDIKLFLVVDKANASRPELIVAMMANAIAAEIHQRRHHRNKNANTFGMTE